MNNHLSHHVQQVDYPTESNTRTNKAYATSSLAVGMRAGYSRVAPLEVDLSPTSSTSSIIHSTNNDNIIREHKHDDFDHPAEEEGEGDDGESFLFLKEPSGRHPHKRHVVMSMFYVVAMAFSSLLSLITYGFMIRTILGLTGRWFVCAVTAFLQFAEKLVVYFILRRVIGGSTSSMNTNTSSREIGYTLPVAVLKEETDVGQRNCNNMMCCIFKSVCLLMELVIVLVTGICYLRVVPMICREIVNQLFRGIDGVVDYDWNQEGNQFARIASFSRLCGIFYLLSVVFGMAAWVEASTTCGGNNMKGEGDRCRNSNYCLEIMEGRLFRGLHVFLKWACGCTGVVLLLSFRSAWIYLIDHPLPVDNNVGEYCDPMDTTECLLPFPSSFYSVKDHTTETGLRVNVPLQALRSLFRGKYDPQHPLHLNEHDGFSTSGTILFYLDGIKEAGGVGYKNKARLMGPNEIDLSMSSESMTLLLDVDSQELVPHFAEIDFLDDAKPLVIIQSAKSLAHNRRYAVALVNAADENGQLLPGSQYLLKLLSSNYDQDISESEVQRGSYYRHVIIPMLYNKVAPWLDDDSRIQMLFDFQTSSINSQLGMTRKTVKDSLDVVKRDSWGGWGDHNVRLDNIIDTTASCGSSDQLIARIVHFEIDAPHFLQGRNRAENLNSMRNDSTNVTRPVKIIAIIPCSIASGAKPVKALVDYGHGFFGSRKELLYAFYFHRVIHTEGYIAFASNWRGMSFLDLAVIQKAFISNPNQLDSVVANIMQGFANKAVVQHFVSTSLLDMDFMKFDNQSVIQAEPVRQIFYGISQGGILGSAYSTLLSNLSPELLDGAIITSGGSPLSLLMSRSSVFPTYQSLLLMSLHNNRCVRIFISLIQMYYDKISGPIVGLSGFAKNKQFRTLMQAGLGDPVVTTIGTEVMARDYEASMYPSNPKTIYGIYPNHNDSNVCITELMYSQEFLKLPSKNLVPQLAGNSVHEITRQDEAMVLQMQVFINDGEFLDVCNIIGCTRGMRHRLFKQKRL